MVPVLNERGAAIPKRETQGSKKMKTKVIVGHEITLEAGTRYRASRPFNEIGRTEYQVSIRRITDAGGQPSTILHTAPVVVIDDLSYEEASKLVNAFNNGISSFEGRMW